MSRRTGFGLVEMLVVILLAALLLQGVWSLLSTFRRAGGVAADWAEGLETVRTVAWILGEEFAGSEANRDWRPGNGDTVSLRAFRGVVLVGSGGSGESLRVCFEGIRAPNPAKDSVLFLSREGEWTTHSLESRDRGEAGCLEAGEGWEESWVVEPMPMTALFGRVFERGSYHFAQGAFRYRGPTGGRQPLTPLRILDGSLGEGGDGGGGLSWDVLLAFPGGGGDSITWSGVVQ